MVNVGIIGAGRIGQVHMNSILTRVPNAKIKAVADPFLSEEADKKAKAAGAEYTTKDYKDILADKDIDAVIICSSTDTHSPISIEAIKAGKHVFCEKPIDHDVDKIKEVIKTLEGTGLKQHRELLSMERSEHLISSRSHQEILSHQVLNM